MANTTNPPAKDKTKAVNSKALNDAALQQDQLIKNLMVIEATYGDDTPFETEKSIQKTQIHLATGATSMLLAGREMVRIKEHTPHGEFQDILKNRLGINPNTARTYMNAAIRFSGMKQITSVVQGRSALLELLTLDDGDISALDDGGTVAGLTLDEIDRMPTSELRAQLRKHKEDLKAAADAHERQLSRKDQKINELDKQLDDRKVKGWTVSTEMINTDVVSSAGRILEQIDVLDQFREEIVNAGAEDKEYEAMAINYFDSLVQAFDAFNELLTAADEVFGPVKNRATAVYEQ